METLGNNLRRIMKEKGVTQNELARRSGVDRVRVNQIINERATNMTLDTLRAMAAALNVTPDIFLQGVDPPPTRDKSVVDLMFELQKKLEELLPLKIPVRGSVPAGYPMLVEEEANNFLELKRSNLPEAADPTSVFALTITGDSLIGDGIQPGDYVLVYPTTEIIPGKIYVVRVGNEVTVKHLTPQFEQVLLSSSNDKYPQMALKEVEVLGRVFKSMSERKH
jgi:SOS-response transcriptional repressor LexA